jgi:hypothetical protein
MRIIVYIFGAFILLRYAFSPSYRIKTNERWKRTPTHKVVFEVGAGLIGLLILGGVIYYILTNWNGHPTESGPTT